MATIDKGKVKIAALRLADSAPVVIADAVGLFTQAGLDVEISIEASWADVADKLSYGLVDCAVMMPPLALALALGLRGPKPDVIVPIALSTGGNSLTLSRDVAHEIAGEAKVKGAASADAATLGRGFAKWLGARASRGSPPPRLGIEHIFSTQNLLLRYWLAGCGLNPDQDVELVVVPPGQTIEALVERRIVGFFAGAPWGKLAADAGFARPVLPGSAIWQHHPEKCLAVSARFAEKNPQRLEALLGALLAGGRFCETPANTLTVAAHIAERLGLPQSSLAASLPGAPAEPGIDRAHFFDHAINFPWRSQAYWFLIQMARWGWLDQDTDFVEVAARVYQPDLYAKAAAAAGLAIPLTDWKPEGGHDEAWTLAAAPQPIAMMADRFCDGKILIAPAGSA